MQHYKPNLEVVNKRRQKGKKLPKFSWRGFWQRLKKLDRKTVLITLGIVVAVFILLTVGIFAFVAKDLPSAGSITNRNIPESTRIYDRTGETLLYEIHGEENRTVVPLEDISDYLKQATIAIEDQEFYSHHGFNVKGFLRAMWLNLFRDYAGSGSGITQQFVKNSLLTPEKTIIRKLKELILSIELEWKFEKDEILSMYLNEIPYGSNAYGVQAAAQTFFEKSAKDLTLAEAATLAALPQAPTYYSPFGSHPEILKGRQEAVLNNMVNMGFIKTEEAEAAKAEKIKYSESSQGIIAPHFVLYVKQQLVDKYSEEVVENGGLKVTTTLNIRLQHIAERAVPEGVTRNERYGASNAALVATDPKTGQILAMQGSKDYFDLENDGNVNVAIRDRQPGSSFKPYAYATAFKKGYTPETLLFDVVTDFGNYAPRNATGAENGPVTMRQALAGSLNIPAVKTLYLAGVAETIDTAHKMGITTLNDSPDHYGLSLVLGGGELKLLDHVGAFGVFANDGKKQAQTAILKVEDHNGEVLEEYKDSEGEQVIDSQVARQISSVLSDSNARASVFGASSYLVLPDRPVAAKTGTTQEYRDGWTMGYTPNLVVGTWAGNNDNTPMVNGAYGANVAAPIWNQFMREATSEMEKEYFIDPKPENVNKAVLQGKIENERTVNICSSCEDKLANANCPSNLVEEKIYKEVHNILYYVYRNNPRGDFPNMQDDPQYGRWEGPVQLWAEGQGYINEDPPTDYCLLHEEDQRPAVSITAPDDGDTISAESVTIIASASGPQGIANVQFYVNDKLIDTDSNAPYRTIYNIKKADSANLKAVVTDNVGNVVSDQISVTLNPPEESVLEATITSPVSNETINTNEFPYTVSAHAESSVGVKKLEFFLVNKETSEESFLGEVITSQNTSFDATLTMINPGVGNYQIYVVVTDTGNEEAQSKSVSFKVE
ncbi:MAG: PBP1A family penicillin-binding protein [bacterium]